MPSFSLPSGPAESVRLTNQVQLCLRSRTSGLSCSCSVGSSGSGREASAAYSVRAGHRGSRRAHHLFFQGDGVGAAAPSDLLLENNRYDWPFNKRARTAIVPRCTERPASEADVVTEFIAETLLPTRQGRFRLRGYRHTTDGGKSYTEPCAVMCGQVENKEEVLCRVHDACYTSEVLGSLKCDCAEQLQLAMDIIQEAPPGLVIYLQQEGRGIGLANKIAAYALQEKGLDTVDANRALGLPDDCREYTSVRNILDDLGIKSVRLITNNPRKISELRELGVIVTDRVPCIVQSQQYNEDYLAAKQSRMDHMFDGEKNANGEFCYWNHEGEPSSAGLPLPSPALAANQALPNGRPANLPAQSS